MVICWPLLESRKTPPSKKKLATTELPAFHCNYIIDFTFLNIFGMVCDKWNQQETELWNKPRRYSNYFYTSNLPAEKIKIPKEMGKCILTFKIVYFSHNFCVTLVVFKGEVSQSWSLLEARNLSWEKWVSLQIFQKEVILSISKLVINEKSIILRKQHLRQTNYKLQVWTEIRIYYW